MKLKLTTLKIAAILLTATFPLTFTLAIIAVNKNYVILPGLQFAIGSLINQYCNKNDVNYKKPGPARLKFIAISLLICFATMFAAMCLLDDKRFLLLPIIPLITGILLYKYALKKQAQIKYCKILLATNGI
jgi:hypothetical protein